MTSDVLPTERPVGVPYHRVLADGERRIGRGIAALALLLGGLLGFAGALGALGAAIDAALGRTSIVTGGTEFTPVLQASTLLPVALLLPWSMLIQRWLYGVRGASLHSVAYRFRFDVFGRALFVVGPIWVVYITALVLLSPSGQAAWAVADLLAMFVVVLLLTPLQAAAEEYGFRGLAFRVAASWGRGPRTALALGVGVSSLLFALVHFSTDPWLNLYYLTFGVSLALITWRTGGVETAVVIHAVNNTLLFLLALVLHADLTDAFDRSAGAGSIGMLVPCAVLAATTAVVWLRTRGRGPALTA
ncbi:CAAX protease self-immunity [Pseudonocardia thermophila]|uniref:CAAX protease self-immunity n=1 Tax=Pseudonocardia thermophila TaxID=1848 RepID=A0A1M6X8V9_PSETH|nr:CPBP family intramembrane glutamic endopeptidase [Pseudonocardia thermophila]SHL02376.1 CAAX protease self-immunity [Pseudonocardia thermophila]